MLVLRQLATILYCRYMCRTAFPGVLEPVSIESPGNVFVARQGRLGKEARPCHPFPLKCQVDWMSVLWMYRGLAMWLCL